MIFKRIRNIREDSDKTQQEIADYLGMSQTVYSRYERGIRTFPIEFIIKLADYYGVSIDFLLEQTETPDRH